MKKLFIIIFFLPPACTVYTITNKTEKKIPLIVAGGDYEMLLANECLQMREYFLGLGGDFPFSIKGLKEEYRAGNYEIKTKTLTAQKDASSDPKTYQITLSRKNLDCIPEDSKESEVKDEETTDEGGDTENRDTENGVTVVSTNSQVIEIDQGHKVWCYSEGTQDPQPFKYLATKLNCDDKNSTPVCSKSLHEAYCVDPVTRVDSKSSIICPGSLIAKCALTAPAI